jgi:hypothetical protein
MSQADEFTVDGTRLFNPNKPHGTVYGGSAEDGRWVQDGVTYRGDRKPVRYVEPAPAEPKTLKLKG